MLVQTWWNPSYPRPEYIPPPKKGQRFGARRMSGLTRERVFLVVKQKKNQTAKEIAERAGIADSSVRAFLYSLRNDDRLTAVQTVGKPTKWSAKCSAKS